MFAVLLRSLRYQTHETYHITSTFSFFDSYGAPKGEGWYLAHSDI